MLSVSTRADVTLDQPHGGLRRYATRHEATQRDAYLAWWEIPSEDSQAIDSSEVPGDFEGHHHFALLLDISHSGASVALDYIPPDRAAVWLRLDWDSDAEWTEAEVVGVTTTVRGPHLVHLAFRSPCSFEILRWAICG